MSTDQPFATGEDGLIVERVGEDALVFDARTDEVHLVPFAVAEDLSRRSMLRAALIAGSIPVLATIAAPTAASAMCLPGTAGPLATPYDLETAVATFYAGTPTGNVAGQFSFYTYSGTQPLPATEPALTATVISAGHIQGAGGDSGRTITNPTGTTVTVNTGQSAAIVIRFTVPGTVLTGTGVRFAAGSSLHNSAGGSPKLDVALYRNGTRIVAQQTINNNGTLDLTTLNPVGGFFTAAVGDTFDLVLINDASGNSAATLTLRYS